MNNAQAIQMTKRLAIEAQALGVDQHVYVVGGAVRNYLLGKDIKDIDVMVDSVSLRGYTAEMFAQHLQDVHNRAMRESSLTTNQYGVSILTLKGSWRDAGVPFAGITLEIANARKESYGLAIGKGYKPHRVEPASAYEDIYRREFTVNTLMWRMSDLQDGPAHAEVIDLTGKGLQHLERRLLVAPERPAPGDATCWDAYSSARTSFRDDPTRMLRAVKFMIKYGFDLGKAERHAIVLEGDNLKSIPQNAISTILTEQLLSGSIADASKAMVLLKELALLRTIEIIMETDSEFSQTMNNWVRSQPLSRAARLIDLGLPCELPLGFLTPAQRLRLLNVIEGMGETAVHHLLEYLRQPTKVLGGPEYTKEFMAKHQFRSDIQISHLMQQVTNFLRAEILEHPTNTNPYLFRKLLEEKFKVPGGC